MNMTSYLVYTKENGAEGQLDRLAHTGSMVPFTARE
jgi:hypothetical protein